MKVIAVFAAVLAVALAAPTEVANIPEKPVAPAEEKKPVEKPEVVVVSSIESENVDKAASDKVVVEEKKTDDTEKVIDKVNDEVKTEDKDEPARTPAVPDKDVPLSVDETVPVPVVVVPEDEVKSDEETSVEDETEKQKRMDESSAICRASTGATLEQITAISDKPEDDAPKAVKCYVKCIDEHLGIVKDQVVQNVSALASDPSKPGSEEAETAVDNCGSLDKLSTAGDVPSVDMPFIGPAEI